VYDRLHLPDGVLGLVGHATKNNQFIKISYQAIHHSSVNRRGISGAEFE
jgi:hypothetical protein